MFQSPWPGRGSFHTGYATRNLADDPNVLVNPTDTQGDTDVNDSFDSGDDEGSESEGVAVGQFRGQTYVFIGLERVGGVMIYDISEPAGVLAIPPRRRKAAGRGLLRGPTARAA